MDELSVRVTRLEMQAEAAKQSILELEHVRPTIATRLAVAAAVNLAVLEAIRAESPELAMGISLCLRRTVSDLKEDERLPEVAPELERLADLLYPKP